MILQSVSLAVASFLSDRHRSAKMLTLSVLILSLCAWGYVEGNRRLDIQYAHLAAAPPGTLVRGIWWRVEQVAGQSVVLTSRWYRTPARWAPETLHPQAPISFEGMITARGLQLLRVHVYRHDRLRVLVSIPLLLIIAGLTIRAYRLDPRHRRISRRSPSSQHA